MTLRASKPAFNVREKLTELGRRFGLKGSELAAAETAQEARDLVSAGRKNLFINGDMQVAQRGTSTSSFGATNGEFSSVDRWQHFKIGTTAALWTASQDTDAPDGYRYSLKYDCTTADASPDASARHQIQQRIEAYNTNHLGFGTSSAKDLVLSFWVKATLTGLNYAWIYNSPNNVFFPFRYYINSSNTWEKKVFTIPGDTANTMSGTNGTSLICAFPLYMGTNYTGNAYDNPGVWQEWNSTNYGKFKDSTNHASSTNNNFWITGVQLEVGKNATEFEHRSYSEELGLCQRYFLNPLQNTASSRSTYPIIYASAGASNGWTVFQVPFPVAMRVPPALSHNISDSNFVQASPSTTQWAFYRQNQAYPGKTGGSNMNVLNVSSNTTQANVGAYYVSPNSEASAILFGSDLTFQFSAEL